MPPRTPKGGNEATAKAKDVVPKPSASNGGSENDVFVFYYYASDARYAYLSNSKYNVVVRPAANSNNQSSVNDRTNNGGQELPTGLSQARVEEAKVGDATSAKTKGPSGLDM